MVGFGRKKTKSGNMKMTEYFLNFTRNKFKYEPKNFLGARVSKKYNRVAALLTKGDKSWLLINPKNWNTYSVKEKKAILRHEAIHYRFPRHDYMFDLYAKKFNTNTKSGGELKGRKYRIIGVTKENKEVLIKEYLPTEYMEANAFLRQMAKLERIKAMQGRNEYKGFRITNR
jgi:hypothetical protein